MTERNDRFAEHAKRLFDESVDHLDANSLSRLNRSRHAALAHLGSGEGRANWSRWLPVTGVAAAAIVAVVVMRGPDGVDVVLDPATAADFEMLLDEHSLEMLEELEFYRWLEASDLEANGNVG
jgi:hypothetical protein